MGSDTINGKGGADIMTGLAGDDTYIVDNVGDSVVEKAGEGTDSIRSSVTYSLPANVEKLVLTGTSAIDGTGNGQNNTITGNSQANLLTGRPGADRMYGNGGNDTYSVDDVGDQVIELTDGGVDTVRSIVTYKLGSNVENLVLTGTAVINGAGNGLANSVTGNSGSNTLNGGLGNDTLTGGAGQDRFLFNTALNATTNVDLIKDFNVADDRIRLENAIFTALTTTGTLAAASSRVGTAATTATQRIFYNPANGYLFYDADGTGPIAAKRFARLAPGLALTSANLVVQ
jgi:Ca2+-binding RTX toxin-like protein